MTTSSSKTQAGPKRYSSCNQRKNLPSTGVSFAGENFAQEFAGDVWRSAHIGAIARFELDASERCVAGGVRGAG